MALTPKKPTPHPHHTDTIAIADKKAVATGTKEEEEPDSELSDLVESFQKLIPSAPPKGPSSPETLVYVSTEMENLKRRQGMVQEQIESKKKDIASLRETLLVVSGALQGLQHVRAFIATEEAAPSSSLPSSRAEGDE